MTATLITNISKPFLLTLILALATAVACAQSPNEIGALIVDAPQAVLLKKTDRILVGMVRLNGNFLEIEIANQSRVSIPRDQVEFVGADAAEVYEFKCRSVTRWLPGDHFKMARWCSQNQLLAKAIEHYAVIEKAAPDYPLVKQLGVEIEQKILSDEKFRAYAGLGPLTQAQVTKKDSSASSATTAASTASSTTRVTDHPQIALYFNDRIQPILVNRCSQSACHGVASKNSLKLMEPTGAVYARVSSENLKSTLEQINRDASGTAKLLVYATKPHGLQREPGIALTETNLIEELKNWIRFSENPIVPAVATSSASPNLSSASEVPSKLNPLPPGSSPLRAVPNSKASEPKIEFPSGATRPSTSEIDALEAQLNQILAKEKPSPANSSADPFDPAEFNRQR